MTAARTSTRSNAAAKATAAALAAATLAAATVETAKAKAKIAIFSRKGDKVEAALFITVSQAPRAPLFGGKIAGEQVSAFLRHPEGENKRPFLSFVNAENVQVGTANVVVRKNGIPAMKALLGTEGNAKTEVWFSVSKNVGDDMLATMGANMEKLHHDTTKEAATV